MPKKSSAYYSMWEGYDLERERVSMGKSQAAFAGMLGMSHRMYCYYERNEKPIPKSVEYAVRYVAKKDFNEEPLPELLEKFQGTLTDYERSRMTILSETARNVAETEENSFTKKILQQSSKELDLLLSKFDK